MTTIAKPARSKKLTITLDDEQDRLLHQTLQRIALDRGQPLNDLVLGVLRTWAEQTERQEDDEDLAAIDAAEVTPTYSWKRVRAEMLAAEARAMPDAE